MEEIDIYVKAIYVMIGEHKTIANNMKFDKIELKDFDRSTYKYRFELIKKHNHHLQKNRISVPSVKRIHQMNKNHFKSAEESFKGPMYEKTKLPIFDGDNDPNDSFHSARYNINDDDEEKVDFSIRIDDDIFKEQMQDLNEQKSFTYDKIESPRNKKDVDQLRKINKESEFHYEWWNQNLILFIEIGEMKGICQFLRNGRKKTKVI